jgi:hypothetical protein
LRVVAVRVKAIAADAPTLIPPERLRRARELTMGADVRTETRDAAQQCAELSGALWAVRGLLERLAYRLEVQRALVETGRATWVARAAQEVEIALEQVRGAELVRAVDTAPVALALGLDADATLSQIAALAPAPWDDLLAEHRTALLEATRDLTESAAANRDVLAAGAQAVEDVLARFTGPTPAATYGPTGARQADTTRRLFDQST